MEDDGRKDYLTPVLNEADELPDTEGLRILYKQVSGCVAVFSLYGDDVDEFLNEFLEYRAIEQKFTADLMVQKVFTAIFKPSSRPLFNLLIHVDKELDLEQFRMDFPAIDLDKLEERSPDGTFKYFKAEVDAALLVHLYPPSTDKDGRDINRGYVFTEMKMFTAPREEKGRSLQNLLRKASLDEYFRLRYIYGVIGVSYLRSADDPTPSGKNDDGLQGLAFVPTNILHVAFMDARVLDDYENATERTEAILSAIQGVQRDVEGVLGYDQKNFKFELTYNILKVIKMSQKISSLTNKLQKLKREMERVEQEKQRAEEEKQRAEEEKQRAEEEIKRYREKLKSLGINPDSL